VKLIKKLLLFVLLIIVLVCAGGYIYLLNQKPQYSGKITLEGLQREVEILFDEYGIPHIYGQNEEDVYLALGYVHAQERLFQMEIMRRFASGRLSEILGKKLLKTDRFFRTLGMDRSAQRSVEKNFKDNTEPVQKAALSYLAGINQFVEMGKRPIEFTILGIPREKFTPKDIYLVGSIMAFGFAEGFKIDPIIAKAHKKLGMEYLRDWSIDWAPGAEKIPIYKSNYTDTAAKLGSTISHIVANLPVPPWIGSNGWVVSSEKSKSGKVIFANDAHMAYSQPSVWYEAHMECPGFSFYGNHAAGIPFGLVGHNRFAAWGLTMFENDDVDFYREKANPDNPNQVWVDDHWEDLEIREEVIKVKGQEDVVLKVRISRHGPLMNAVSEKLAAIDSDPVSVWWAADKFPSSVMHAFYLFAHARSMDDARKAASLIDAPGLNVMYGDIEGNIAWWASDKLVKRPAHVNSKLFLDGSSGKDEPLGWYDFSENPRSENPPWGFVYSANNQPEKMEDILYPGYYVPENRAKRIVEYLDSDKKWAVGDMKSMSTDVSSPVLAAVAKEIVETIENDQAAKKSPNHEKAIQILKEWHGAHQLDDVGPVIYYKLLYYIMENSMADELGEDDFQAFISTHLMKRTTAVLIPNDRSLWWDNVQTKNVRETRKMIFAKSFEQTVSDLETQLGSDISQWRWGKVHTLEHGHLLGRQKPLDKLFNVGPFPVMGGNEVINNLGFRLNKGGYYKVKFGPSMRRIIDFADIENSLSVNPTGQSGNFMSRHYDDQAQMFNRGEFRKQMMNRKEIEAACKGKLILSPELEN